MKINVQQNTNNLCKVVIVPDRGDVSIAYLAISAGDG